MSCGSPVKRKYYLEPSWSDQYSFVTRYLAKHGAAVIQVGELITIILPSDKLFNPDSSNYSMSAEPLLGAVATLLRLYGKVDVVVYGFTDCYGYSVRNKALAQKQADNVANYLFRQNVDVRMMYGVGMGSQDYIATNESYPGIAMNRRIVIQFRYWYTVYNSQD
jgi:outer membrane protein OmpA-like peptidoglycan-associated protein